VTILEPAGPVFVEGDTLRVTGQVQDDSPVRLLAGSTEVELAADGSFSFDLVAAPGAHRLRFTAIDAPGNEGYAYVAAMMGQYGDAEALVPHAISMELGSEAMTDLSYGTSRMLEGMDLGPYVRDANPVAEGSWGEVNVQSVDYEMLALSLLPASGSLRAQGAIQDLDIGLELESYLDLTGSVRATRVVFDADIEVQARDGRVVAEIIEQDVTVEGFIADIDNFPGFIESLVSGLVEDLVERKVEEALAAELPSALEDAMMQIPSGHTVDIFGSGVEIVTEISEVDLSPAGIFLDVAATAYPSVRPIGDGTEFMAPGPLRLTDGSAPPRSMAEVAANISLDAINAMTFNAWAGETLNFRIDEIPFGSGNATLAALAFISPELRTLAPLDTPLSVEIAMGLPPVVVGDGNALMLQCAEVRLNFIARIESGEQSVVSLSLGLNADLSVELGAAMSAGELSFLVEDLLLTGDLFEGPESFGQGPDLDALLRSLSRPLTEKLGALQGLQIPTVYGFGFAAQEARHLNGFVHVEGSLDYTPEG
jgi:hypothetical protein